MSVDPKPLRVLEYQSEWAVTWAPVVRICAWVSVGLGLSNVFVLIGAVMVWRAASLTAPLPYQGLMLINGIIGIGMIAGGWGCLRLIALHRRILVWCCGALIGSAVLGMGWQAIQNWMDWANLIRLLGLSGLLGMSLMNVLIWASWNFFAPALLFLLLRRPEARRVFETAR